MGRKLNFKVSARTARLIGRENVANAESAVIELVKNAYDADATHCILFFDKESTLHILDDGHGMTEKVIEDHWMTIGTNNKQTDFISPKKRIKSGEKGIGRFALDRLGAMCVLQTRPASGSQGYTWKANWGDFENKGIATIDEMDAELETVKNLDLNAQAKNLLANLDNPDAHITGTNFKTGTLLSIQQLRDVWELFHLRRLHSSLVTLIPPKEETDFTIYLFSEEWPGEFGKIDVSPCDDFDYKVVAKMDHKQNVTIRIHRNEIDLEALDKDLFKRKEMKLPPFDKKTFYQPSFVIKKKLSEVVPGFKDQDKNDVLGQVGEFSFSFYFLKKQPSTEKYYFNKDFNAKIRNAWLEEHAGIKVFRDGFRVRPYGERNSASFDWLGLGTRASLEPAAVSRYGRFRVRDYNVSGVVKISRVNNPHLQDKSSREGIQENQISDVFKEILVGIIRVFEDDRSYISEQLKYLHEEKNPKAKTEEKAKSASRKAKENKSKKGKTEAEEDREALAEHAENLQEKVDELLNEQKILRVLASSGAMFAAFGHELNAMQTDINDRASILRSLFEPYADPADLLSVPDEYNPWVYVDEIEKLDRKLLHWMKFALSGIRKDKRNRKNIFFKDYFESFSNLWKSFLETRKIDLHVSISDDIKLRGFEVEVDTIFNNLLINSVEAFNSKRRFDKREIYISCKAPKSLIEISYKDTGPGLSSDIDNPERIFDLYYSTKRDPNTGKQIGTGIGMYLIKSIVTDYKGSISLPASKEGFSMKILLPKS